MLTLLSPSLRPLPLLAFALALAAAPAVGQSPQSLRRAAPPPPPPVPAPPSPTAAELTGPPADAQRLPSGLAYKVLREGLRGEHLAVDLDIVSFYALGRSPDGQVFQNSFAQGKAQRMQVRHSFPAWREVLRSMAPGEIRRWWVPADALPPNPKTGRKEPAIFDIEIVGISRLPLPPQSVAKPDSRAKLTPSGASVLTLAPGRGDRRLGRNDGAMVSYTIWNPKGDAVASSIATGRPTLFPMDKVMSAFADCLAGMAIGERRNCWIPAERNEGFPGASTGPLIFEVELLNITDFAQALQGKVAAPNPGGSPNS